jgi:glycosyltransferase involved in cell wall biosynthesis
VLLEALSLVAQSVPNVVLLVVGDGPERAHLEERARALGLDGHIVWLGARGPEELPGLYGVMDVVAIPSLFEGFGLVAVEAMAAARPVVAFATGGLTETVADGVSGKLVSPGDRRAFAEALVSLIADHEGAVEMGKAGRRIVQSRFSQEKFSSLILSIYRRYGLDAH